MKVIELKYKSFTFPISKNFINSTQSFCQKEVILLKAKDEDGNIAFGEVSPLPGFSKENISNCKNRLKNYSIGLVRGFNDSNELNKDLEIFNDVPSLKFGLEQVLIGLMYQNNLNYFKNVKLKKNIKVNGSIGFGSLSDTVTQINKILEEGITTVKLKVGRVDFKKDLEILEMIKLKFRDEIKLRLDVNGAWTYEEAKENLYKLEKYNLQYVEQPVKDKGELLLLAKNLKINIAPDESIKTIEAAMDFIKSDLIKFLILKPTIRLGIFDTLKIIRLAEEKGKVPIITTSFETAIGRSMLVSLAGTTDHNYSHGLGFEVLGNSSVNSSLKSDCGEVKQNTNLLKYNYSDLWD